MALAFAPGPEPDLAEARRALKVLKIEELKEQQLRLQRAIEQSPDPEEQGRLLGQKLSLAQQIHGLWGPALLTPGAVEGGGNRSRRTRKAGNGHHGPERIIRR